MTADSLVAELLSDWQQRRASLQSVDAEVERLQEALNEAVAEYTYELLADKDRR